MSLTETLRNALWNFKKSRKAKLTLLVVLLVLVVTGSGYVLFAGGGPSTEGAVNENVNTQPVEQRARRAIDGVMAKIADANHVPVAVVIENQTAARPQAGLNKANLVYETLTEGGITRFLSIFASGEVVEKIGPVRSARTVHLNWVKELSALFAHAGGSPEAIQKIPSAGITDLNQMFNSQYFDRDPERLKRLAREHTLYTTSVLLARAIRDKEMPLVGSFEPWLFADEASLAERPSEPKSIAIEFSTFQYKVEYRYNRETNNYDRYQAEQPHVMEDGSTISVKNVVVQYAPTRLADAEGRLSIETTGEGEAIVFQNGKSISATWKKSAPEERTRYVDETGGEIRFVPGSTWIEVLPNDREVTYT